MLASDATLTALREALATWYHARRRQLPWREDPAPYRVWVSEIMLQQTQVATVLPYFERFLTAFPTVQALADADLQAVLGQWAGLGYYRRARHLHAAARDVVAVHGGQLPKDPAVLTTLPGVGRYTAAAIASIAFGVPVAVLDGNVSRVLARLVAEERPVDKGPAQRDQWALAEALLDRSDPASHNQAMMELGALVCAPKTPDCPRCPASSFCAAHQAGRPVDFPRKALRTTVRAMRAVSGFAQRSDGAVLFAQRPDDGLLAGLWELPSGDLPDARQSRPAVIARAFAERLGLEAAPGTHLATVEHVFTHRHLTLDVYAVTCEEDAPLAPRGYLAARWVAPAVASLELPLSRLTQKVLEAVGAAPPPPPFAPRPPGALP